MVIAPKVKGLKKKYAKSKAQKRKKIKRKRTSRRTKKEMASGAKNECNTPTHTDDSSRVSRRASSLRFGLEVEELKLKFLFSKRFSPILLRVCYVPFYSRAAGTQNRKYAMR